MARRIGGGALAQRANVADAADVAAMFAAAFAGFGRLDILVNNAGVTHLPAALEEVSEADFDRVMAVNAKAIYLAARHAVPHMKANRAGSIVNMASTAGLSPRPRLSWYNASKGWAITATKAMAVELAPFGIRVNALCPVAGETPLLASFMGEDTPEMRAKFLSTIPLGRFSTPEDLGNAACFLCLGRGGDDHRRGDGSGRGALHMTPVNLAEKLAQFGTHWDPHVVAEYNGNEVMVVKFAGEFPFHSHPDTDDFFLVLDGEVTLDVAGESHVPAPRRVVRGPCRRHPPPAGGNRSASAADRAEGHPQHRRPGDRRQKAAAVTAPLARRRPRRPRRPRPRPAAASPITRFTLPANTLRAGRHRRAIGSERRWRPGWKTPGGLDMHRPAATTTDPATCAALPLEARGRGVGKAAERVPGRAPPAAGGRCR